MSLCVVLLWLNCVCVYHVFYYLRYLLTDLLSCDHLVLARVISHRVSLITANRTVYILCLHFASVKFSRLLRFE